MALLLAADDGGSLFLGKDFFPWIVLALGAGGTGCLALVADGKQAAPGIQDRLVNHPSRVVPIGPQVVQALDRQSHAVGCHRVLGAHPESNEPFPVIGLEPVRQD
ncbi:MAG TPA: hypothetical protein PLS63_06630, partial [Microthrixaceae bacterium]|nr:hypothetical protein [Microthrixaceae bacterium]